MSDTHTKDPVTDGEARLDHVGHPDEPMPEGEEEAPRGVRTMAIIRWALVVLMAVAAVASIGYYFGWFSKAGAADSSATLYYCPMHPSVVQDHPGECPICSMSLVPKVGGGAKKEAKAADGHDHEKGSAPSPEGPGAYYCPMHPEVTSDDPNAKCDKCGGMKLMPRPASNPGTGGSEGNNDPPPTEKGAGVPGLAPIDLTPERIQLLGMRTAMVAREKLAPELRTVGFVTANEEGLARIHTRFAGWIETLAVSKTGQHVSKGEVLASVYSPELLAAQQELLNALKWSTTRHDNPHESEAGRLTATLTEDARRRLELLGISGAEIDELARRGKPVRALKIRSPVEGYVTRKNALQGQYVQPGTELFEVANLSTVWVLADVYEYEIERVKVGAKAEMQLAAFRGQTFAGRVEFIYPTLNADTRTLRVRLVVKNKGLKLRPGMYGDVAFELPSAEGLVVPAEAIVDTGTIQYVFLALPGGRFEPRKVRLGLESEDKIQILEGVSDGDTVVTTANFLIDSESRLHAAISGEAAAEGEAPKPSAPGQGPSCETEFDKNKHPDKYQQCRACEVQHRGMGTMEEDCKRAIPKPWR